MLKLALLVAGITLMFVSAGAAEDSYANHLARQMGLQGRVIWFDADANLWELSTRQGVANTIAQCKAANINTIILDVKPLSGLVLYNSKIAPHLVVWDGKPYPEGYDLLATVVEEAHKVGIEVHAAVNVFSEGSNAVGGGAALKHRDWQCVQYEVDRHLVTSTGERRKLACSDGPSKPGEVHIYCKGPEPFGELSPNTTYVRVAADGTPVQCGVATGRARISAPEGGCLLFGVGKEGQWLKECADNKVRLQVEGTDRLVKTGEIQNVHNAIFVNPIREDVRKYELAVISEIIHNYRVDGIVFDRMRYPNIYADFSPETRAAFEKMLGRKVEHWPEEVFKRSPIPGDDVIRGPLFKDWLKFRAGVTRDFLAEARETVKSIRKNVRLGIYVGSWYPLYYDVGINWGSPNHSAGYEWWPEGYERTGYADLVDYMMTGCYYTHATRAEAKATGDAEWMSVEAAADESLNAIDDATFVYGSLYLYQYAGQPEKFREAMRQCLDRTQGLMLFDLVYLREYNWWPYLQGVFPAPAKAPHDDPNLLRQLREHHK